MDPRLFVFCLLPSAFCLLPSAFLFLPFPPGILSAVLGLKGMVGPGGRLIWFVRPRPLRPTTSFRIVRRRRNNEENKHVSRGLDRAAVDRINRLSRAHSHR